MKKYIAAGAAALVLIAGSAFGVRQATADEECVKPLTILSSQQDASIAALETYIEENIAPKIKNSQELIWQSDDFNPTITPGKISARIAIIRGFSLVDYYRVTIVRDCQGDEGKVVEFKKVGPNG